MDGWMGHSEINLFGTRILHLNFSTSCMENVNNTGTKKGSIMK